MQTNIKSIFDVALQDLKLDADLFKQIDRFTKHFIYKNDDHVNFFGSNLTGVYPVRFTTQDKNDWNIATLDLDDLEVRRAIVKLPHIKETWVRGTDVMNMSCLYLVHRIQTLDDLSPKLKHKICMDVLLSLHFKLISSLMAWFFKYPVDPRVAEMTYANLSRKFAIKQHGTWLRVLENRCSDILASNSIHKVTLERFNDDMAIQNMINDIQGRLRAMIKKIWAVMAQVRSEDAKMLVVSGKVDLGDKVVVRDLIRDEQTYIRYLKDISIDATRFIKTDLIGVVGNVITTMPEHLLREVLVEYCKQSAAADPKTMEFSKEIMLHAFEYLNKDRTSMNRNSNLGTTLLKFRALYMASRNKEPRMIEMKNQSEQLAHAAKTKSSTVIASLKTGLMLYILLRTLSKQHYN